MEYKKTLALIAASMFVGLLLGYQTVDLNTTDYWMLSFVLFMMGVVGHFILSYDFTKKERKK